MELTAQARIEAHGRELAKANTRLVAISGEDGHGGELATIREALAARNRLQAYAVGLLVPIVIAAIGGWLSLTSQLSELRGSYERESQQQQRVLDRLERLEARQL